MNVRHVAVIVRKVFLSLRHDRRTLAFLILMPILLITLFGYTFGGSVKNVSVVVVNLDQGAMGMDLSDDIVAQMRWDPTFRITAVYGPGDPDAMVAAEAAVRDGRAWGAVIFPANLTRDVLQYHQTMMSSSISLSLDRSNYNVAQSLTAALMADANLALRESTGTAPPLSLVITDVYGQGARYIDTFAPGVIALTVMMVTFMLSIISFVHERTTGTLDRLLTTTATEAEIVAGHALAFSLFGLLQSCVVLVAASLLFDVMINGSFLLILLILFLLGLVMQGMGLLFSASARTEFQAIQFLPLVLFPSIFLSGVFWPLQSVPELLQPISYVLPLTYAVDGLRSVMIRGWGMDQVGLDAVLLLLFAGLMLVGSLLALRRRS